MLFAAGGLLMAGGAGLWAHGSVTVTPALRTAIFVGVGMTFGMLLTREMLSTLRTAVLPAVLSAGLLIATGIGIAYVLRLLGAAPDGDMLATSPGALSILGGAAFEHGVEAPIVVLFHILRIVLVLVSLPLLVWLLPEHHRRRAHPAPGRREPVVDEIHPDELHGVDLDGHQHADGPPAWLQLPVTAAAAVAGGLTATALGIPGALIFGTTLGAGVVTLAFAAPRRTPAPLRWGVQVGLGWMFGQRGAKASPASQPAPQPRIRSLG